MANFVIDKSRFTPDQLAKYEELVAIGKAEVPPADHQEETNPADHMEKGAPEMTPEMQAAMDDLANLKKSFEIKEMTEVAKKYAALGKNENELAQTLYAMKKSNEANYNAYIAVLDESLGLVEKSGLFAEVGKSFSGSTAGGTVQAKVEAKAQEIMKSDASMDYNTAIAKAWEDPALMAEYDSEYFK